MRLKSLNCYFILTIFIVYVITPWFFEKNFFFNEVLSLSGVCILFYKRNNIPNSYIFRCIFLLIGWNFVHLIISLVRMDSVLYYLRNSVIFYSTFTFFAGYFLFPYFLVYMEYIRKFLQAYVGVFLFIPLPRTMFERFGVAMLFPFLFQRVANRWLLPLLIAINVVYAVTYQSSTALFLALFYGILWVVPGYKAFKQMVGAGLALFAIFFIAMLPNLNLVANPGETHGIYDVINSNWILGLDGNSTWRLVLWKQVIVDHFPSNIFGIGFGTPMMKYFPVEDKAKVSSLPYVLGAHNSFIYLFGRLGIIYLIIAVMMYRSVFIEYFYHKTYYYTTKRIFFFWSFFAISIIAMFNPTLESPIFSGAYWFILGLLAKAIYERNCIQNLETGNENIVCS